jgi:hypothetical protein
MIVGYPTIEGEEPGPELNVEGISSPEELGHDEKPSSYQT